MSRAPGAESASLVWPRENVRNICILAHVDHGKTTCADNLISANGIISRQSAGKIRYLDSRVDEQERQITMKSSAIAIRWRSPISQEPRPTFLVNLIDSPGHVDFTSEVSTAARLADGALIVIDVVEGVQGQTRTVLRQAYRDRVKTCLLLNKVDRLMIELELTPSEAYQRLVNILEQINAANQQLLSEEVMAEHAKEQTSVDASAASEGFDLSSATLEFDMAAEEAWRYSPENGNVAFGSAAHGWAFQVGTFARVIAGKMGARPEILQKVLWGEWTFNKKTRKVQRRSPADTKSKPMFVEFILQPLFSVYEAGYKALDLELLTKMQAQIPGWKDLDLGRMSAGSATIRELCSRWLPFSDAVLQMATDHLPSPPQAAEHRMPVLCPRWFAGRTQGLEDVRPVAKGLRGSDPDGEPVAYLAKFLAADLERLVLTGDTLNGDEDVQFVGISRVFSGTLRPGQDVFIVQDDDPTGQKGVPRMLRIERLFQLMGRFLQEVAEAPAGSILAVQVRPVSNDVEGEVTSTELGVERYLTLCGVKECPCFETPYSSQAFAIVRVSLEPQNVTDIEALDRGLRLLHRADPSVTIEAMPTGENVLGCCGDEHLKRCMGDLQKLYARGVPLTISTPLVAVRESIARCVSSERIDPKAASLWLPSWMSHLVDASAEAGSMMSGHSDYEDPSDVVNPGSAQHQDRISMSPAAITSVWTANRKACIRISAIALPESILSWMDEHAEALESVLHRHRASVELAGRGAAEATLDSCLAEVEQQFQQLLAAAAEDDPGLLGGVMVIELPLICGMSVAKGSRAVLLDTTGSAWTLRDSYQLGTSKADGGGDATAAASSENVPAWMRPNILTGFQLAASAGPLCEEPMRGVALIIHSCQEVAGIDEASKATVVSAGSAAAGASPYGPMSGQMMVATKEACRLCLFRRGFARISEAMLLLEVQCEQAMLGKVYSVLSKRRAKVQDEGLREGTSLFYISSFLPLADSFGLAHDLRQAASGHVSFHCAFSHWEQTEDDPFQEASLTAEELEELGDQPLPPNNARKLIDAIRKRKGLPTDEKVV
eukprot:CAMPEP_0115116006 /NCGR_PEP_ID=MMETSP0227-20121206/43027_1 /TAXON_ID=89957 /ORGANISM="Polarella glacialis, Strain CCMP 1383" /LENGTH=1060 /DNA_ID=CAMNT_0002516779 /DNA_START=121 /DNA_END=3300 /DNA_ORIENTATION=-